MKKILLIILFVFVFLVAFMSKPDDKTCIIAGVKAVWGNITPDAYKDPGYFEQFMDVTSKAVKVDDWIFVKRIQYKYGKEMKTVGYGAFKRVMITG